MADRNQAPVESMVVAVGGPKWSRGEKDVSKGAIQLLGNAENRVGCVAGIGRSREKRFDLPQHSIPDK